MAVRSLRRVAALGYLVAVSVIAGGLIAVVAGLHRLPVIGPRGARRLDQVLLAGLLALARPADRWGRSPTGRGDTTD